MKNRKEALFHIRQQMERIVMNRRLALAAFATALALLVATHGFAADHREGTGKQGVNYFAPTTIDASLGYRAVFAYTDNGDPSGDDMCHVTAQFFDARGGLINEGSFHLRFGESSMLDLKPRDNNEDNGQELVRLVVTHEPFGCASATSEVTRDGATCWLAPPGSIVPLREAPVPER